VSNFIIKEDAPVFVEFELHPGAYEASLSTEDIAKKSAEALDQAMNTIHNMARRVTAMIDTLPKRPAQVEVEFGITLNMEAGAIIAKAGVETTLHVKLVVEGKEMQHGQSTS